MQKVAILVDVQNIYYTTRQAYGRNFDYNEFWRRATSGREVVAAYAYACDRGDQKQKEFQNILRAIGFDVKLKTYIQRKDGSAKCDWDVGIAVDAMVLGPTVDAVVLASGDGDFEVLVRHLQTSNGNHVDVFGVPELTAEALEVAASKYYPIENALLLHR